MKRMLARLAADADVSRVPQPKLTRKLLRQMKKCAKHHARAVAIRVGVILLLPRTDRRTATGQLVAEMIVTAMIVTATIVTVAT